MDKNNLSNLNDNQRQGVTTTEGPVLILAGAGSGKTRVLTERIAYLMYNNNVNPYNIMAITFTNKAAKEMRQRVDSIVGPEASKVWVSTFHSSCVRILRSHAEKLGYTSGFSIYDTDDSKAVMKEVLKRLNIDTKAFPEKVFLNRISSAKDKLLFPKDMPTMGRDPIESRLAMVYKSYQRRLLEQNAMDFDDLIVNTVVLFRDYPEVLETYQQRFKYIMVDEYQDTNTAQFELIRMLADAHKNICVVGDDDQSIYKFRGANIYNILNFEGNFDNCTVIKLEENYRSTSQILDAANAVIKNNRGRKEKALWTSNPDGEKIQYYRMNTSYDEASYIAEDIDRQMRKGKLKYSDFAILYRTNMQSRSLEEKLLMDNIPYTIVGGTNFYQRKEIKDAIAYLKTIDNGKDDIAVLRVINTPRRGIGNTTIERVMAFAASENISFYEALCNVRNIDGASKAAAKIDQFIELIHSFRDKKDLKVSELLDMVLTDSGYISMLQSQETDDAKGRIENLGELISKAVVFENENPGASLSGFLEEVALIAEIDNVAENDERVLLMTLHSAKGLEFENVYISGLEEGIFPGIMTINSGDDMEMEEERRLLYVGITRAKRRLVITSANSRMVYGETRMQPESRFIKEIPEEMMDIKRAEDSYSKKNSYSEPLFVNKNVTKKTVSYLKKSPAIFQGSSITKEDLDYKEGDRVFHIKFKEGVVVKIVDGGKDYEVTVDFDIFGTKKMFASFAKLKKI